MQGSLLDLLYNEAIATVGIVEQTIDSITMARTKISTNLRNAISNHVATEEEVLNDIAKVVFLANLTPGPVILFINPSVGYGLFADRDYSYKESLTSYGGIFSADDASDPMSGDYVIEYGKNKFVDGRYNFKLSQKGRFVNEQHDKTQFKNKQQMTSHLRKHQNVKLVMKTDVDLQFEPLANGVSKGKELIWYYGKDYERPWMEIGKCVMCEAPIVFVCSQCLDAMYCSEKCAAMDWKAMHGRVCNTAARKPAAAGRGFAGVCDMQRRN